MTIGPDYEPGLFTLLLICLAIKCLYERPCVIWRKAIPVVG